MTRDAIQASVAAAAKSAGFKGGPRTWRKSVPLGIAVLNLQKSQWGDQYYINFGVYVRSLGALAEPRTEQCHYNARAGTVDPTKEARWKELLDLERPIEDLERQREIAESLRDEVFAFLERVGTEEGLRAVAAEGRLTQGVRVELRRHLGMP